MTAEMFEARTGRKPEHDDLERVNCTQVGSPGHYYCGWCEDCDRPRFECGCPPKEIEVTVVRSQYQTIRLPMRQIFGKLGCKNLQPSTVRDVVIQYFEDHIETDDGRWIAIEDRPEIVSVAHAGKTLYER